MLITFKPPVPHQSNHVSPKAQPAAAAGQLVEGSSVQRVGFLAHVPVMKIRFADGRADKPAAGES